MCELFGFTAPRPVRASASSVPTSYRGLCGPTALMRPTGISDLEPKSVVKKFKDKKFAAGCNRDIIRQGAELVGLDLPAAIAVCIGGMKPYAAETGLLPKE